jgi:NAD(P)-dependent dehydrogenase (short-subunit alcohol dehydrogenase family)
VTWIENKRVVVTGATSGVGRAVAACLASLGAEVVLACRDDRRAKQVAASINTKRGAAPVTALTVDTSDQRSIRAFAAEFLDTYGSLDVLVNNAGVILPDRRASVDDIELTFATNVLGYHLLAGELVPAFNAGGRIVNVASTFAGDVDLDDLQFERRPYDGMRAYAQSKACDRMLTWALARRLGDRGITANAMAPGLMLGTRLYRDLPPAAVHGLRQLDGRSVTDGADTVVWLASSPELQGVSGRFFEQRTERPCQFREEAAEENLWRRCQELAGVVELQQ